MHSGRVGWPDDAAGEDFCYVTTRGRRTGRPHTIEIWFGLRGRTLYLLAGGGPRADWVRNLVADPRVEIRLAGRVAEGSARPVTEPEEDAAARRLLAGKYQGWREGAPLSGWARTALAVAIDVP
ncbi:MAG: nitroreductase family deazaflavin-dependent oxidoreductase [Actinomycetota bacterium]|nr:nitroreductase family deazaflavin-dependent oxidoreductase [Actinomycetota bacterium]